VTFKFLQVMNDLLMPSQNVHLQVNFISSHKNLALSIIIDPVIGFSMEHTAVNHISNTWSNVLI
jgi:hypothetical protein